MREVIAVCRSTKRSRERVAAVLDHYLWRIGGRTWRGRASNACLDRMARELRRGAKRNTAVVIHEIRSAHESRVPIIRIGARHAFSPEGLVPVFTHSRERAGRMLRSERDRHALAILRMAALWHDVGKATILFQDKLHRMLKPKAKLEADAVRHELHSAVVWDIVAGELDDDALVERLRTLDPKEVDQACTDAVERLRKIQAERDQPLGLAFSRRDGSIAHAVGMLVLTHHRLPDAEANQRVLTPSAHVPCGANIDPATLAVAPGTPFWHAPRWRSLLRRATDDLRPGFGAPGLDMALRASLMFADHLGSALRQVCLSKPDYLANTRDGQAADPLDVHVERVWERVLGCYDMLHRHRERYPALGADQVPLGLLHPVAGAGPFAWQATAAAAAAGLCGTREGGFFACILAGTGTGKTRGAPTILAAAAFADAIPTRRYLRLTLALGLRSLASQAAQDYREDLSFAADSVTVLIGQAPVRFADDEPAADGAESAVVVPDWLQVERAGEGVPAEGSSREGAWLRSLSHDTGRGLPATLDLLLEHARSGAAAARRLVAAPVVIGTIDHLMGVAAPARSGHLFQTLRVLSADLILDEIDQYGPEDIAAIGRLVFQAAAGGRRVIAMSATLTREVAVSLHAAYREGWRLYARQSDMADHVHVLCASDAPGGCVTNGAGEAFDAVYSGCREQVLTGLRREAPQRPGHILPPCDDWTALLEQVDGACHALHDTTATTIDGMAVSVGFVRMTRVQHAAALAVQLPGGRCGTSYRVVACLHARFPRLHRAYMERALRRALTRKGAAANAGLRDLCVREGLLHRARGEGCDALEIVVVCSPVIETGNDLDFDWAIVDPSSMRAVVQAAGRVWRHRVYHGTRPNLFILGRSAVAMQDGVLARPGVETPPHGDTLVGRVSLAAFEGRHVAELLGVETFARVSAAAVLDEADGVPWRAKEACLRQEMVSVAEGAPLGHYIRGQTARLTVAMTRSRMFRRTTVRDLRFFQDREPDGSGRWMVDFAPGTRNSEARLAKREGLRLAAWVPEHRLWLNLPGSAMAELESAGEMSLGEFAALTEVRVPDYGRANDGGLTDLAMTYGEWTGFTRGRPEDLFAQFGQM